MNELDDANLDRSLRDKFAPYGKQPSDGVWNSIEQKINQPPVAAKPARPWLLPLLFMGGLLLLLTGNLLPNFFNADEATTPIATTATIVEQAQAPELATANPAESTVSVQEGVKAVPSEAGATSTIALASPSSSSLSGSTTAAAAASSTSSGTSKASTQLAPAPVNTPTIAVNPAPAVPAPVTVATGIALETTQPETPKANQNTEVNKPAGSNGTEVPAILQTLVALEQDLQPVIAKGYAENPEANSATEILQAQIVELNKLKHRADSLLQKLEYVPVKPLPVAKAGNEFPNNAKSRWSAALAFAPEQSFMSLHAPASDTLSELRRNHETGRSGYNASVAMYYQLNNRLSIGAGIGVSSYGAELRVTDRETIVSVKYDTIKETNTQVVSSSYSVVTVHIDTVYQLNPVLNSSGQVISYDSIPLVSHDSTTHVINQTDTLTTIQNTITPLIDKTEVTSYRVLKPTYNFVTLPVSLKYRLTPGARWWADVEVGAQLQLFRGGTQLVTHDGRNYHTERIRPNGGPFRPVNLALMGNLALNYGLTDRLSVSVAPAVRWQTMSVYKKETGFRQQPFATGLQFGVRFAL